MNIATMRLVDRWAGVPVCAALTVWRRGADLIRWLWPGRAQADATVSRIVFVKLAEQGSTVLAYRALCEAVNRVGRENVFFLAFEENRFILDVMEVIPHANVVTIPTGSFGQLLVGLLRAIRTLRRLRVDAAIDMEFFARSSAILAYLSGARHRVGYHAWFGEARYRGDLMTHRVSFNPHCHASDLFHLLVVALDQPPGRFPAFDAVAPTANGDLPMFRAAEQEVEAVRAVLREATRQAEVPPLILLNANCSDLLPLRRWADERYIDLARRLLERYPEVSIAFTGGPSEAAAVSRLVERVGSERCICMAGRTTLRQLLILYGLAEVLVTNDSGPAHFATLTPIDVVTLFGPETPALFAARSPRSHVLWAGLACSPCVNAYNDRQSACRDNLCMQKISVDAVFAKVCAVYEKRRAQQDHAQAVRCAT